MSKEQEVSRNKNKGNGIDNNSLKDQLILPLIILGENSRP